MFCKGQNQPRKEVNQTLNKALTNNLKPEKKGLKMKSSFKLKGKILKIDKGVAEVSVIRRWRTGHGEDQLVVDLSKCGLNLKPGDYVEAVGSLENSIDDQETKLVAAQARKSKAGYENIARIVGRIYQNTPFDPTASQPGYTNLLVEAGKSLFNATAFRGLGLNWASEGVDGREVDFEGHLQRRPMIVKGTGEALKDDKGNDRYSTEMICRNAARNRLKPLSAAEKAAQEESKFSLGGDDAPASEAPEDAKAT